MRKRVLALLVLALGCGGGAGREGAVSPAQALPSALDSEAREWVEETLASLSLRDQVAQLVIEWMPGVYVSPSAPDFEPLRRWVDEDHIGGVSTSI